MEVVVCSVHYDGISAGALVKTLEPLYYFAYFEKYLKLAEAKALSISLPLQKEPFVAGKLFPFFEGLLSEGWLRRVQSQNQKIDETDSFTLLAENGKDLIGAVTVELVENE